MTHRVFLGDLEAKRETYRHNLKQKYLEKIKLLRDT